MTPPAVLEVSPSAPAYLTAAQVGELLQVSEKSVYRWAASDASLPTLRIAGTVRFPRERLLTWLRDREQGRPRTRSQVRSLSKPAPKQEAVNA